MIAVFASEPTAQRAGATELTFRFRQSLTIENAALRHQIEVRSRNSGRFSAGCIIGTIAALLRAI